MEPSSRRLPIREALQSVLGSRTLPLDEIVGELERRGWMPYANDVSEYVRHVLSREVELFEPVGEG
jgi:hypothetical protein